MRKQQEIRAAWGGGKLSLRRVGGILSDLKGIFGITGNIFFFLQLKYP